MDELQSTEKNSLLAAKNALSLLLLRVERGLRDGAQAATGRAWEPIQNVQSQEAERDSSKLIAKSVIIERACNYILTHIDQPFSIEDVASYAYVSSSYLTRLFRADLKTSVMEYALKERLKTAHSLLANTELPVQQIARFVGYSQTPQFNRIFKRIHGVTPTQFRRDQRINHNVTRKAKE